jgi:TonB-linked SusC/RagA family outer membrane protein
MRSVWKPLAILAVAASPLIAQGTGATITGTITDVGSGRPVDGVRVQVAGTALSGLSDDRGMYRISNVTAGEVRLQARRVGYRAMEKTVTVSAGVETKTDFAMTASAMTLDEVVVTGTAGDQSKRAQGATVAQIPVSDIMAVAPARSFDEILQSRTTGVSVTQASGTSGGFSAIRVRGAASISLNNDPLIYVDGVLVAGGSGNAFGLGGQATGRMSELNAKDIESIEVVKGPAAATLYGANASTGVIQIITKRGRQGSRFSQTISFEQGTSDANFTPPDNYAFCTVALARPTSTNPLCRGVDTTTAVGGVTKTLVSDNPLVRESAFRDGSFSDVQWSGRGGGSNFGYYASLLYGDENGTTPNNAFNRRAGRLNYNWTPTSKLSLDAGVGLVRNDVILPDNDNNVYGYLGGGLLGTPLTRHDAGTGNDGWFGAERDVPAIRSIENTLKTHRTIATATANYVPLPQWTHRVTVGADWLRDEAKRFFPKNARGSFQGLSNTGDISERRQGEERYTFDYLTNYRLNTGADLVHNFSAGAQLLDRREERVEASGQGLTVNSNNVIGAASSKSAGQDFTQQRQVGFIGQAQTTWKDRLSITAGARMDANSSFGNTAEWFFLPKVGVSYVVSEESFFRDQFGFMNTMRLRGAWGQTGRSPTPGAALQTLEPAPFVLQGASQAGAIPRSPGNDSLKAERGVEFELGFDAGFMDDRIGLEFTYFDKTSKDLLLQRPLPPSLGFSQQPFVNIGELKNNGIEVGLNAQPIQMPNLAWDVRVGVSTLNSEITDMGDVAPFGTLNRFEAGFEPGMFVGLRIRSIDEATGVVTVSDDFERIGPVLPTHEGNISSTFTIMRNFRLFALGDWKGGHYLYNNTDFFRETQLVRSNRRLDTLVLSRAERLRRYGNPTAGQPAFVREGVKPGFATTATVNEVRDAYVQPAGFFKLREVSLSYTLPSNIAARMKAQDASITLTGRNLKTITDYEGFDPEVISGATNNFARSDFLTLPPARQFALRLNMTF